MILWTGERLFLCPECATNQSECPRQAKTLVNQRKSTHGGKRPNSGRKSKAEEMGLQALLDKCWTLDDREKCVEKLATKASDGDMEAIKLLMAYAFGRPKEKHEHDGEVTIRVTYADD